MLTLPCRPHAVIFDMDGLLFDTETMYRDAMFAATRALGIDMPMPLYLQLIGLHGPAARALVRDALAVDTDALWNAANENFALALERELTLKEGVAELLDVLDALALPRAIATSSSRASAEHHLAALGIAARFDAVIAAGDYLHGKPAPDPYLLAAATLKVPPARCLALEDSYNGVRSAVAAGMATVMVPDLLEASDEMRSLAMGIASSLHEVAAAISAA
jgi:HAD superfamily hydrolase (TIGR01509 family)